MKFIYEIKITGSFFEKATIKIFFSKRSFWRSDNTIELIEIAILKNRVRLFITFEKAQKFVTYYFKVR